MKIPAKIAQQIGAGDQTDERVPFGNKSDQASVEDLVDCLDAHLG